MDSATPFLGPDGSDFPSSFDAGGTFDVSTTFDDLSETGQTLSFFSTFDEEIGDYDFASHFSDVGGPHASLDAILGGAMLPGLEAAPQYPTELVFPGEDAADLEVLDGISHYDTAKSSGPCGGECEPMQHALEHVHSTANDAPHLARNSPGSLWAKVVPDQSLQLLNANLDTSTGNRSDITGPAKAPTEQQAAVALETLKRYLHSQFDVLNLGRSEQASIDHLAANLQSPRKRQQRSPQSSEPDRTAKFGRVAISASKRKMLQDQFDLNPYITDVVSKDLATRTGLPVKTIRTWYSNNRSRQSTKSAADGRTSPNCIDSHAVETSIDMQTMPQGSSRSRSKAGHASLLQSSMPQSSYHSSVTSNVVLDNQAECDTRQQRQTSPLLDRYLATPTSDEGLSNAAIASAAAAADQSPFVIPVRPYYHDDTLPITVNSTTWARMRMKRTLLDQGKDPSYLSASSPRSAAGSDTSMYSGSSVISCASSWSMDPRGPRRGRKSWVSPGTSPSIERIDLCHGSPFRPRTNLPPGRPSYGDWTSQRSSRPRSLQLLNSPAEIMDAHQSSFKAVRPSRPQEPFGSAPSLIRTRSLDVPSPPTQSTESHISRFDTATSCSYSKPPSIGPFNRVITSGPARQSKQLLFCTWPECSAGFRNRSEWSRHEEAKHYNPYHWVCCLTEEEGGGPTIARCPVCQMPNISLQHMRTHDELHVCATKDIESRTFLRKDHLEQHIARVHDKLADTRAKLTSVWRIGNPALSPVALHCGFCGQSFTKWPDRQEHVYGHLRSGDFTKASWSWDLAYHDSADTASPTPGPLRILRSCYNGGHNSIELERNTIPMTPSDQNSVQLMTVKTQQGHYAKIPVDYKGCF